MWGNRIGWGISAGMAIVMIGLMVLLQWSGTTPSDMTPKFAADAQNLAPLVLTPAPESILSQADACDAADKYREAIAEYQSDPKRYDKVNPLELDQMPALDLLVEATNCREMTLFRKDPGTVINFEREKAPVEALRALGRAAGTKANMLRAKGDKGGATKYAEAAFALGTKMYKERVVFEELDAGFASLGEGSYVLAALAKEAGDADRANQYAALDQARIALMKSRIGDLHAITKTIDGNMSARRAGDVFALAEKSKERLWRVEACLQLARTHRFVGDDGRAADQRYAQIVLRRLADNDPDPVVKTAATKARDITDEQYNKQ